MAGAGMAIRTPACKLSENTIKWLNPFFPDMLRICVYVRLNFYSFLDFSHLAFGNSSSCSALLAKTPSRDDYPLHALCDGREISIDESVRKNRETPARHEKHRRGSFEQGMASIKYGSLQNEELSAERSARKETVVDKDESQSSALLGKPDELEVDLEEGQAVLCVQRNHLWCAARACLALRIAG
jgi:hypothetical protein